MAARDANLNLHRSRVIKRDKEIDRAGSGEIGPRHELRSLERRLDDGFRRIEDARRSGQSTTAWEDFWIQLLHEYESLADDLAAAA